MDALLTYSQAAELLGMPEAWVRRAAREGTIPRRQFGRTYRFHEDDIAEVIAKAYRAARDPYARTARQLAAMNRGRRAS